MKKAKAKRSIHRTVKGLTKVQVMKQLKSVAHAYKKEVGKILKENDMFYCNPWECMEEYLRNCSRGVNDVASALCRHGTMQRAYLDVDLMTRKEMQEKLKNTEKIKVFS